MKLLIIILGLILLVFLMPLSVRICYDNELSIKVGVVFPMIRLYPTEKKEKHQKKSIKDNSKESVDLRLIWNIVKQVPRHIRRLLTIHKLQLRLQIGHEDPGDLALLYGSASAVLDSLAAVLSPIYPRENWKVDLLPDFDSDQTIISGKVEARTNLWRIIYVLISLLICGILPVYRRVDK